MQELFDTKSQNDLVKLGSFWVFQRKRLVRSIELLIAEASNSFQELEADLFNTKAIYSRDKALFEESEDQLKSKISDLIKSSDQKIADAEAVIKTVTAERDDYDSQCKALRKENDKQSESLYQVKAALETIQEQHDITQSRYELISQLLKAEPKSNSGLADYKQLLNTDYMLFASEVSSEKEEANALLQLQAIETELELIVGFPDIYSKNILAVAGGFSSGKSEFINGFIATPDIKLTVGINPVTAIPAYVVRSSELVINAYSSKGGAIEIGKEGYGQISHEYVKSFGFNLKELMPYISIGAEMDEDLFKHVCLIDTPGYNPAKSDGYTEDDLKTASQYAEQSNAVLWVMSATDGILSSSDVDFLHKLDIKESKPLYIVLNKADLMAEEDLEDVLDAVEDVLDDEGFHYAGISAYSSILKKEFTQRKQSLHEFLESKNNTVFVQNELFRKISHVFQSYKRSLEEHIAKNQTLLDSFKSIHLDILETADVGLFDVTQDKFIAINSALSISELVSSVERADEVQGKMSSAVVETFKAL